jgi:hypothetical protein
MQGSRIIHPFHIQIQASPFVLPTGISLQRVEEIKRRWPFQLPREGRSEGVARSAGGRPALKRHSASRTPMVRRRAGSPLVFCTLETARLIWVLAVLSALITRFGDRSRSAGGLFRFRDEG